MSGVVYILSREAGMRLLRCNCVAGSLRYTNMPRLPAVCCKRIQLPHLPYWLSTEQSKEMRKVEFVVL